MQCNEFLESASQWMEGERPADAATHLSGCRRCQAVLADLEAIWDATHHLAETDVEPPAHLWATLRDQLETEGLIRSRSWTARLADVLEALPRPALAGAYLALLLVAALLVGLERATWQEQPQVMSAAESRISSLPTQLATGEETTISVMHEHNPAVAASYREGLAIVDNFIALCEKSVREEPENELAREYLYGAYQQKAELLGTMMERGATAD